MLLKPASGSKSDIDLNQCCLRTVATNCQCQQPPARIGLASKQVANAPQLAKRAGNKLPSLLSSSLAATRQCVTSPDFRSIATACKAHRRPLAAFGSPGKFNNKRRDRLPSLLLQVQLVCTMSTSLLLIVVAFAAAASVFKPAACAELTATNQNDNDAQCKQYKLPLARTLKSEAESLLLLLKCDIKPIYKLYEAAYGSHATLTSDSDAFGSGTRRKQDLQHAPNGSELANMVEHVHEFASAFAEANEFGSSSSSHDKVAAEAACSQTTIERLVRLRNIAIQSSSKLLMTIFDLISIDAHRACLDKTISSMPKVPFLVKDVVKIYIDGIGNKVRKTSVVYRNLLEYDDDDDDGEQFNVDKAISENGALESVVGLVLMFLNQSKSDAELASDFRFECNKLQSSTRASLRQLESMGSLLDTSGNAIKLVNEYAIRALAPTKFAKICAQISERA